MLCKVRRVSLSRIPHPCPDPNPNPNPNPDPALTLTLTLTLTRTRTLTLTRVGRTGQPTPDSLRFLSLRFLEVPSASLTFLDVP